MSAVRTGTRRRAAIGRLIVTLMTVVLLDSCASGDQRATSGGTEPGVPSGGPLAPSFSLEDQFGRQDRLSDFRGTFVLLTFIDSRCATICPLTAALLRRTQEVLAEGPPLQLIAVNANPRFTSVAVVRRWSARHLMTRRWLFLTGPAPRLRAVWSSYGIQAEVVHGDVEHTVVVFVIDPSGRIQDVAPIARRSGVDTEARALAGAVRQILARES